MKKNHATNFLSTLYVHVKDILERKLGFVAIFMTMSTHKILLGSKYPSNCICKFELSLKSMKMHTFVLYEEILGNKLVENSCTCKISSNDRL